jgi:hypothetical protein
MMGIVYGEVSGGGTAALQVLASGKLRTSSVPYGFDVSEGNIPDHEPWAKIGYNGALVATTEADLWPATGVYAFPPTTEQGLEVVSSDNTKDIGTVIKGAMNDSVTADATGTTTTLTDADVDFTGATAVAVGDVVLLDPHGTTPEWGYVTTVAAHTLTVAGGFSSGGSAASRKYAVVDQSAYAGAQVVLIEYLDGDYAEHTELVALNGTTAVATVNTDYIRINGFRVVATGTDYKPTGNLSLREVDNSPVYSYITAGFTQARNSAYTVPAGRTLYITEFTTGWAYQTNTTHWGRVYLRANVEPGTGFRTGSLFFPYAETLHSNSGMAVRLDMPIKFEEKTDLKVSALSTFAGAASIVLRGWIETE